MVYVHVWDDIEFFLIAKKLKRVQELQQKTLPASKEQEWHVSGAFEWLFCCVHVFDDFAFFF